VIVTTTNPKWAGEGRRVIPLPPLSEDEVAAGLDATAPLSALAGRPLMVTASRLFRQAAGRWWWASHPVTALGESAAPRRFWAAVDAELGPDGPARALARGIAWLPPTGLPRAALAAVLDDPAQLESALRRLTRLGLVDLEEDSVTMHRLFRSAVREDGAVGDKSGQLALISALLDHQAARDAIEVSADLETAQAMVDVLADWPDLDTAITGLHHLGRIFERQESARSSARWYELVLDRLGAEVPARHTLAVVDALRGKARARMRASSGSEARSELEEAIGWMIEAAELCRVRQDKDFKIAASQVKAMRGLLLRKRAATFSDQEARLAELREAERFLRASAQERAELVDRPENSPEVDRSRYNLAGLEVRLAQDDARCHAPGHLEQALGHYEDILGIRRERYRTDELEEVVCCINGQAIVAYYRAVLLEGSWAARSDQLRRAAETVRQAAEIRQELAGESDDDNTSKSLALEAKIALARLALAEARGAKAERDTKTLGQYQQERARLSTPPAPESEPGAAT
jgi:hypothetical protein